MRPNPRPRTAAVLFAGTCALALTGCAGFATIDTSRRNLVSLGAGWGRILIAF